MATLEEIEAEIARREQQKASEAKLAAIDAEIARREKASKSINWSDVPRQAISNAGSSAANLGAALIHPILHPIETVNTLADIGVGLGSKAVSAVGIPQEPKAKAEREATADAVGQFFKDRYGSEEGLKRTLAHDPVGAMADAATILTGGGAAVSRVGPLARAGNVARRTGEIIDPVRAVTRAIPSVARGATNVATAIAQRARPLPADLGNMSRGAARNLTSALNMDNATRQGLAAASAELGERGMVADLSPSLTDVAEGLNQQPGRARTIIGGAYEGRAGTSPNTVRGAYNAYMGPPINVPRYIQAMENQYGAAARPFYEQFHAMQIPQSPQLNTIVGTIRNTDPDVFSIAMRMAQRDGVPPQYLQRLRNDPMTAMTGVQGTEAQRVWQGVELDYMKRALDQKARNYPPGSREQSQVQGMARNLRTFVDEAISPGQPDQSVWAQGRAIAGTEKGVLESLDEGRNAWQKSLSADQLEMDNVGRSALERDAFRVGAREAVRSDMDAKVSNFGPRGDIAGRRLLNAPENQRKMEQIIGPQRAAGLQHVINAENTFAENYNQVMAGSPTARRQAVRDLVPRQIEDANMASLRQTSLSGFVAEGAARIANLVTAGALNARNMRMAEDMANALVAQGVNRDAIVRGLMEIADQNQANAAVRNRVNAMARRIATQANRAAPVLIQAGRAEEAASTELPALRGGFGPKWEETE